MRILGVETSCDETAASVIAAERGPELRVVIQSDVVSSQIELHRRWGGVVPELASRNHLVSVMPVIEEALVKAGARPSELDAVAVTAGPGLVGALLVGVQVAKSMAMALDKPLVKVNHLEGHLRAIHLDQRGPPDDFVGLVVSGGHTALFKVDRRGYRRIGSTRDDAAGEAFDKVAKMLGLPYPGGAEIDHLARGGDPGAIRFPRALRGAGDLDFSFSGLKTAVLHEIQTHGAPQGQALLDLCASFQEAVADVLSRKALAAVQKAGVGALVVSGGVAANSRLRSMLAERALATGAELFIPPARWCTDNGAMIACAGFFALEREGRAQLDLDVDPGWSLGAA